MSTQLTKASTHEKVAFPLHSLFDNTIKDYMIAANMTQMNMT